MIPAQSVEPVHVAHALARVLEQIGRQCLAHSQAGAVADRERADQGRGVVQPDSRTTASLSVDR
jgi:hypothetical protein